jgi:hypothetical protein
MFNNCGNSTSACGILELVMMLSLFGGNCGGFNFGNMCGGMDICTLIILSMLLGNNGGRCCK